MSTFVGNGRPPPMSPGINATSAAMTVSVRISGGVAQRVCLNCAATRNSVELVMAMAIVVGQWMFRIRYSIVEYDTHIKWLQSMMSTTHLNQLQVAGRRDPSQLAHERKLQPVHPQQHLHCQRRRPVWRCCGGGTGSACADGQCVHAEHCGGEGSCRACVSERAGGVRTLNILSIKHWTNCEKWCTKNSIRHDR